MMLLHMSLHSFTHKEIIILIDRVITLPGSTSHDDWKTLSVNPAVNGYLFRIREG